MVRPVIGPQIPVQEGQCGRIGQGQPSVHPQGAQSGLTAPAQGRTAVRGQIDIHGGFSAGNLCPARRSIGGVITGDKINIAVLPVQLQLQLCAVNPSVQVFHTQQGGIGAVRGIAQAGPPGGRGRRKDVQHQAQGQYTGNQLMFHGSSVVN